MIWNDDWRSRCYSSNRIGWKRSPLDGRFRLSRTLERISTSLIYTICASLLDRLRLLLLWPRVVVRDFGITKFLVPANGVSFINVAIGMQITILVFDLLYDQSLFSLLPCPAWRRSMDLVSQWSSC
jgi:hypothetical protein